MSGISAKKTAFALLVGVFLALNIGAAVTAGMMTSGDSMQNCPFMGVPVLCAMNPVGHVSGWQEMLAATTQQISDLAFLLLLAAAVFWYVLSGLSGLERSGRLATRRRDPGKVFNPLQLAFARGIIHSKAY